MQCTSLFSLKKGKADETGKAPVYARITIDGARTEFSIKRSVDSQKWIASAGMVKGTTKESKTINAFLTTVRMKLQEHHRRLLEVDKHITPETIKNAYFGITEKGKTLVEVFQYHNDQMKYNHRNH